MWSVIFDRESFDIKASHISSGSIIQPVLDYNFYMIPDEVRTLEPDGIEKYFPRLKLDKQIYIHLRKDISIDQDLCKNMYGFVDFFVKSRAKEAAVPIFCQIDARSDNICLVSNVGFYSSFSYLWLRIPFIILFQVKEVLITCFRLKSFPKQLLPRKDPLGKLKSNNKDQNKEKDKEKRLNIFKYAVKFICDKKFYSRSFHNATNKELLSCLEDILHFGTSSEKITEMMEKFKIAQLQNILTHKGTDQEANDFERIGSIEEPKPFEITLNEVTYVSEERSFFPLSKIKFVPVDIPCPNPNVKFLQSDFYTLKFKIRGSS